MAEDSPATFGSLFKAYWPDADDHQEAAKRADEATTAVLRFTKDRSFFAQLLAASIALHLVLLAVLVWLERAPPLKPELTKEIPVDLVAQPPPSGGGSGGPRAQGAAKPQAAAKPAAPKPAPPKSEPPKAEQPKSEPPKSEPPKPAPAPPKPAAAKPPPPQPPAPKPEPPKPQAPKLQVPKPEPVKPAPKPAPAAAKPPPVQTEPKPVTPPPPQPQAAQPPSPTPTAPPAKETSPLGTQNDSPAVTVPMPSEDGDEVVSYQTLIFGMLELKKQFPADALRRGAFGTALVAFVLNDDGTVQSEKILRSSGDAALDVESLALIQRAAPFPKPPPGAQKLFAVDITFPKPDD